MKEYLLIFRAPANVGHQQGAAVSTMEDWKNWIGGIAASGKFTGGQPLTQDGKHLPKPNTITDAPFAEGKEVVNGYLLVKSGDYNEACGIASGCPIFLDGGSVEVREIMPMEVM
jgi:hypothetical protein